MSSLLFPGQGSQIVGMGSEFYNNFDFVKKIFKEADDKLNYHISKIILEGPENDLQLTKNTQPAILTVSYSIFKVMKEKFGFNLDEIQFLAGHSLGEYSALVCSESLKFGDALYLLHERGKFMQEAVPVGKGNMIAVLGSDLSTINDLLKSISNEEGVCEIANDNATGQIILSGDKNKVDLFKTILKKNNIKSIPLKVSAPFHCSLMKPAAEKMREKIDNVTFNKPIKNIVNNVTAQSESDPKKIKNLLVEQIYSTVRWRESIINISDKGIKKYVEIGPGKILTGMIKRTIKNSNCFSINTINEIENLTDEFKK